MPLNRANIDTDQIIPKQFLKRIERTGYGDFLFHDWRQDPDFEINHPRHKGAEILVTGKNFGCGSSREHAAWALNDHGFRVVIAPSFADIFHSNAGKNGILLVTLPDEQVELLLHRAATIDDYHLTVSLEDHHVHDDHGFSATFSIDPFRRYCLLEGLDDIGLTLRHADALDTFEKQHDKVLLGNTTPRFGSHGDCTRMSTNGKNGGGHNPKKYSIPLTEGPSRAAARSYLRGIGFSKEDLHKPIIGIANTWTEIGPCNFHLRHIAEAVKQGVREAGGTPMEFNTITISDGITMGTEGMKASLISREVIADSVELVARGNLFDGLVAIAGCDKNMPGTVMALARLDIPGLMFYGGSIKPGHLNGKDITIQDVFEAIGSHAAGKIDDAGLEAIEAAACPGAGACGGQFTANTMAMACEFLGISPIGLSGVPAFLPEKLDAAREAGRLVLELAKNDLLPQQDHHTAKAIENAIASVAASGGSTNAVLHFLAIANEMGIPLSIDDFDRISSKTPLLCDLKPGGRYVAADYHAAGGSRLLAKRLLDAGLLHGSAWNVTGKTLAEEAAQSHGDTGPGRDPRARRRHQAHRWTRHPQRQSRTRGLRHQGRGTQAPGASRPGARFRLRGRSLSCGRVGRDQAQRRDRDSL